MGLVVLKYLNVNQELRKKLIVLFFIAVLVAAATNSLASFVWLAVLALAWVATVEDAEQSESNFFDTMESRLKVVDPTSQHEFLSYNTDVIELLYSVNEFQYYSEDAWDNTLMSINNFFRLVDDFENEALVLVQESYEALIDEYTHTVSNFHSFIYVLPRIGDNYIYIQKFNDAFAELKILLLAYVRDIAHRFDEITHSIEEPVSYKVYDSHIDNVFLAV